MPEYIEKQHLLDFLDGCIEEEKGNRSQVIVEAIKMTVERMPLDDVIERKRGEWYDRGSLSCRCSNCGCKATKEYSFCPNCGADMRGRKDAKDN
jgi:Zn finger protein HypA/HybF involved in hydrogenase expression